MFLVIHFKCRTLIRRTVGERGEVNSHGRQRITKIKM